MKAFFLCISLFLVTSLLCQGQQNIENLTEKESVIQVIRQMFDGMRAGDSSMVAAVFAPNIQMKSAFTSKEGKPVLHKGDGAGFLSAVGTPHDEVWDERIWSYDVRIDGRLATVWTEYTFYLDEKQLHCGVNAFTLFKGEQGWVITDITDTRRREGCLTEAPDAEAQIHSLMDAWHKAAAVADEVIFFGSMAPKAIYLGTDDSERWLRDEMKEWSKKYFERESAWDFTPSARQIYWSADRRTAWFEEKLATWMGPCRGSGVVALVDGEWKIEHYNLAVTVPNDKIKPFIELMKAKDVEEK